MALAGGLLAGCGAPCSSRIVETAAAPGGGRHAILFGRDCGATTGSSTQVSVAKTAALPTGAGNAFVADLEAGETAATAWRGPWASIRWLSPTQLLVSYDSRARISVEKAQVDAVQVTYEAAAPP